MTRSILFIEATGWLFYDMDEKGPNHCCQFRKKVFKSETNGLGIILSFIAHKNMQHQKVGTETVDAMESESWKEFSTVYFM